MTLTAPRQNRVTPFGEIVAIPERGAWTGNRGCLHDDQGRLGRARWRSRAWIACRLEWKGWRRPIMAPGRWTELFFLDEATSFAAGHRPCAYCRREDYRRFAQAVAGEFGGAAPRAPAIDARLHAERLDGRDKRLAPHRLGDLPEGAMLALDGAAWLVWRGALRRWSPAGYGARLDVDPARIVQALTPALTMAAMRAGYSPQVHATAGRS
jgi:hypothetical protein